MEIGQIIGIQPWTEGNLVKVANLRKQKEILLTRCLDRTFFEKVALELKKGDTKASMFDMMTVVNNLSNEVNYNSIQAMNESYAEESKKVLVKVAYIYCSIPRESQIAIAFDEIAAVLRRAYGELSLDEIGFAFELAACNKLDVSLISYGAAFNLQLVGDVLDAYRKYKTEVKWAMLNLVEKEEGKGNVASVEEGISSAAKWWIGVIAQGKEVNYMPNWKTLPIALLKIVNDRGMLDYEGCEEVKKAKYLQGILKYAEELRELKSSNMVVGYSEKLRVEKELSDYRQWVENGSNLSRGVIPDKVRENGFSNGLKLYACDYIEKVVKGKII